MLLNIRNCMVNCKVNEENKTVHVFDEDAMGMSLTNALSSAFREELFLFAKVNLYEKNNYALITYHTDGTICEFTQSEDFIFLKVDDYRIDTEMRKDLFYRYGQ